MDGEPRYYAHSAPERAGWEPLKEHLRLVAERAARYPRLQRCFAKALGSEPYWKVKGL